MSAVRGRGRGLNVLSFLVVLFQYPTDTLPPHVTANPAPCSAKTSSA